MLSLGNLNRGFFVMATKIFCDACGKEGASNKYTYLCHIIDIIEGNCNGFVDNDMNRVSGRKYEIDLCNKCYNQIVTPSIKKFKEIQKEHNEQS